MKIYIAGKISGLPYDAVKARFDKAAAQIRKIGFEAVNPCEISPYHEAKEWKHYMADCIPALLACDAVYMLTGWGDSPGAKLEHTIARMASINIVYEIENEKSCLNAF
jgi:hypothetical protein